MNNTISLEQLEAHRARILEAKEQLKMNLIAHDGALQQLEQLILLAKQPPAAIAESGEAGHRDAPAEGKPDASQKA